MPYRTVTINADQANDLRTGLSLARVIWQREKDSGDPELWARYSAESMRLSAELYRKSDRSSVDLRVTRDTVDCINSAADACIVSSDIVVADLAVTLSELASWLRMRFDPAS